jgi:lipopolysaccharide heptosyltransferase I
MTMDQCLQAGLAGRRILVVKLSSLGDLFHALPAVRRLKTGLGVTVDWVTQNEYAELVECFTDVERVIRFPRRGWGSGWKAFWRDLRREEYAGVIDFQGLLKSAGITRLARTGYRLGPSFQREGAGWFYTEMAGPANRTRHAVDECLDAVRRLGLADTPVEFPVRFPSIPVGGGGRPRVALVPLSRWPSKNWPVESYGRLARQLQDRLGAMIYLMGGPGVEETAACGVIATQLVADRVMNLAGRTRLVEMGGWLQGMDLVIGNDSGPLHMAAATGTPVLALFGPTDPVRSGPYGGGHRVLAPPEGVCRGCRQRICRRHDGACLAAVTVERVLESAESMLKAKQHYD